MNKDDRTLFEQLLQQGIDNRRLLVGATEKLNTAGATTRDRISAELDLLNRQQERLHGERNEWRLEDIGRHERHVTAGNRLFVTFIVRGLVELAILGVLAAQWLGY